MFKAIEARILATDFNTKEAQPTLNTIESIIEEVCLHGKYSVIFSCRPTLNDEAMDMIISELVESGYKVCKKDTRTLIINW